MCQNRSVGLIDAIQQWKSTNDTVTRMLFLDIKTRQQAQTSILIMHSLQNHDHTLSSHAVVDVEVVRFTSTGPSC